MSVDDAASDGRFRRGRFFADFTAAARRQRGERAQNQNGQN
jgi:hypothetical protein